MHYSNIVDSNFDSLYVQIRIRREAPVPFPSSSRCSRCSCWMPAPLWPHLTRFRCICHLHHHLHWPESHHVTLSPTIKVILIKLSEINVGKLANPITSKQGQVHNSTEPLPEVKLGSTGPQLIKSFGHSAQRSPIPYQTLFRSYYEMPLIVVLNGPHSHTSGRWHWRSRGRRKEGKRE